MNFRKTIALTGVLLATAMPAAAVERMGVNLAGAEFGGGIGTPGVTYTWPTAQEVDYFMSRGMNVFRVPFKWERMQQTLGGPLETQYLASLDTFVAYATGQGAEVILDPHSYARHSGNVIGGGTVTNAHFADLWTRLADHFEDNPQVILGLMNEPHGMPTEQWASAANAAIAAIRAAGSDQLILVPGNGYTGAHSWYSSWYGTPNATVMQTIVDPADNLMFELHQYFDSDSSGTSPNCVAGSGATRLTAVTGWLREHGHRGLLGEVAGANNATCRSAIESAFDYMEANADVWSGWTWWAAGPWWGDYMFTLEPSGGVDAPQMAWLQRYLGSPLWRNGFEAVR